ncbi:MAG: Crp/Fnr family transcriptional regulator [Campylobacterota bacterium]|nr:Crp/Fnr family transcriptional regulator [Campylobacterota bacterium]
MRKDSTYYLSSVKVLRGASLFDGVDEDMMDEILGYFSPVTIPKKGVINSFETKKSFFIIISGRVKISKINPQNGREYIISLLDKGDVFDVISLLDEKEHEVNIEAIDELELLKTPMETARSWLDRNPEFNKNFLPYIGNRMRSLEDASSNLALYDTITRLAKLILDNVHTKEQEESPVKFINDLSHEALAQMIGSVRKVVNLNIQELKKEGVITSTRGNLSVINMQKLLDRCRDII